MARTTHNLRTWHAWHQSIKRRHAYNRVRTKMPNNESNTQMNGTHRARERDREREEKWIKAINPLNKVAGSS